ncbi:hypothetical protein GCM10009841_20420 [Microlunatus panaciterrae]|uniref:MT0933-like antitoxin protein n=1 Tax=Microlunatus panaciterrae TaxID=400768 RepID=A0ABS2RR01_9ACTN|nr:antitoxin [Microlunatus panaciterrae]MBM7800596.1 hypothetical protein [Microlunatus panaciterrae]
MGIFDKAKDAFEAHKDKIDPDLVDSGIDKAGDLVDDRTGDKYVSQVDKAQGFAQDRADGLLGADHPEPGGPPTGGH